MLYKKRKNFKKTSDVIGRVFSFMPANHWTLASLVLSLVTAYKIISGEFFDAAVLLALTAFFDMIDGSVARHRKEASDRGAYYDTITDRYTEGIITISLLFVYLPPFYVASYIWIAAYLFGSMMTTYAKAAAKEKLDREVIGGFLERPERMILLVIGIAFAGSATIYMTYILVFLAVMTNLTAMQRIYIALSEKRKLL